jgi:hypothetical protein
VLVAQAVEVQILFWAPNKKGRIYAAFFCFSGAESNQENR